ncbi:hypothetical protein [Microcoleus sp. B3-A4]
MHFCGCVTRNKSVDSLALGKPQTEGSGDRPTHDCQALTACA